MNSHLTPPFAVTTLPRDLTPKRRIPVPAKNQQAAAKKTCRLDVVFAYQNTIITSGAKLGGEQKSGRLVLHNFREWYNYFVDEIGVCAIFFASNGRPENNTVSFTTGGLSFGVYFVHRQIHCSRWALSWIIAIISGKISFRFTWIFNALRSNPH